MRTNTKLVPVCCEPDTGTYVKLLKSAKKNGVPVRDYIASRLVSFFNNGVCNTRRETALPNAQ